MSIAKETVGFKLRRLCNQLHKNTGRSLKDIGITGDNYMTMNYIYENPGITQAELADINGKDRNVIGKIIDKLESKEFVKRIRGEKDRRSFKLYLTESGSRVVSKYWNVIIKLEEKRLQRLSAEERKKFLEILNKLAD